MQHLRHVETPLYDVIAQASYNKQSNNLKRDLYRVDRGLEDKHVPGLGLIGGYRTSLPKFRGQDVAALIESMIRRQGSLAILDIGCGEGEFLKDVTNKWSPNILGSGISAHPYHDTGLNGQQIQIRVEDAQKLPHPYLPESFDVVVSANAMEHMQDAGAALIGSFEATKLYGVGLLRNFPITILGDQTRKLLSTEFGFTFLPNFYPHFGDITFQKDRKDKLPLIRVGVVDDRGIMPRIAYGIE